MIGLVMIVRNEAAVVRRALESVRPLIGWWLVLDSGSTDGTADVVSDTLVNIPGEYHDAMFPEVTPKLNRALELARGKADWLLRLDADMTVQAHPGLLDWLAADPDPDVQAWPLEVVEHGTIYRRPFLIRGSAAAVYRGAAHEWLDLAGKQRALLGLTIHHHADGTNRAGRLEQVIGLLQPELDAGDARATFYTAECHRFLGRPHQAIDLYQRRAAMGGWDEEVWYARYQAARLAGDRPGLLTAYHERPWRHEPLTALARLVAADAHEDVLFREPTP